MLNNDPMKTIKKKAVKAVRLSKNELSRIKGGNITDHDHPKR